ncbi:hypothetical protein Agub_g11248 [Astrephomene gubernaculifera]|uniref:Uncharacterized protein n=1 Tax=Astrephomene gubernaculifera TaxID=47775 RepID=A0AAD3DZ39_9CHLO|nr:hypothetical protein Agub_g11248 [Astrephomene gubernaculifera]
MTANLRFGALQLACRSVAADSKLVSAATAAVNSLSPSFSLIGEEAHTSRIAGNSAPTATTSASSNSSFGMLVTPHSSTFARPVANAPPSPPALPARCSASHGNTLPLRSSLNTTTRHILSGALRQPSHTSIRHDSSACCQATAYSGSSLRSLSTRVPHHAAFSSFGAGPGEPLAVAAASAPSIPAVERPLGAATAATGVASISGRGLWTGSVGTGSSGLVSSVGSSGLITPVGSSSSLISCSSSSSSSGLRAFGSWGGGSAGGSSGSSGPPEGHGLPPPVIISPVALRVVVIGWMGSSKRYLNKYGALWARSGDHEVLLVRPSVAQTLVRWRGVVVAGRDIDRVARLHRENPAMPTVYHIFSTGGFIHAGTMWRWMDEVEDVAQRRDLLEEVRAIIFDSAPASVNPDMASRAIVSALTHTPAEELRQDMPGWQGALLGGTRGFLQGYLRSRGVQLRTEEVYDAWYNLAPTCPQLYLYSDADPLVPAGDVERYMGVQEGRGVEVSGHKWGDSGHVEHYRRYPHEYAYQISAFLARALKDW